MAVGAASGYVYRNVFLTGTSYRYPSAGSMFHRAGYNRSDVPSSRLMARERL